MDHRDTRDFRVRRDPVLMFRINRKGPAAAAISEVVRIPGGRRLCASV
jgi:hypothetical protein